jgi:hypothetical protein
LTDSNNGNNSGNGRDNRDYSRNKNGGDGDRYDDRDSDNDHEYDDDLSSDESCSSDNDDESSNESDDSRHNDRDSRNKRNGNCNRNGGNRNDDHARKRSRDMNKCPFHGPTASVTQMVATGNPSLPHAWPISWPKRNPDPTTTTNREATQTPMSMMTDPNYDSIQSSHEASR